MAAPDKDVEALERILFRLVQTPDDKLAGVLEKLLPKLVAKLDTSTPPVRLKVIEVLNHISRRVKHEPGIRLPCGELLAACETGGGGAAGFASNFAMVFLNMALPRCAPAEKQAVAVGLMHGLSRHARWSAPHTARLQLLATVLEHVPLRTSAAPAPAAAAAAAAAAASTAEPPLQPPIAPLAPADAAEVADWLLDIALYRGGPSTDAAAAAAAHGLSARAVQRLNPRGDLAGAALTALKLAALRALRSDLLPPALALAPAAAAACDHHHEVVARAEAALSAIASADRDGALAASAPAAAALLGLVLGGAERAPAPAPVAVRALAWLAAECAEGAARCAPQALRVVEACLLSDGGGGATDATNAARLHAAAARLAAFLAARCAEAELAAAAPVLLRAAHAVLSVDAVPPGAAAAAAAAAPHGSGVAPAAAGTALALEAQRSAALEQCYDVIASLAARRPTVVVGDTALLRRLFADLSARNPELRVKIAAALGALRGAYKAAAAAAAGDGSGVAGEGAAAPAALLLSGELWELLWHAARARERARLCAVEWACDLHPFACAPARHLCAALSDDAVTAVRQAALRGLKPPARAPGAPVDGDAASAWPAFSDSVGCALSDSAHPGSGPFGVGELTPVALAHALEFAVACLRHGGSGGGGAPFELALRVLVGRLELALAAAPSATDPLRAHAPTARLHRAAAQCLAALLAGAQDGGGGGGAEAAAAPRWAIALRETFAPRAPWLLHWLAHESSADVRESFAEVAGLCAPHMAPQDQLVPLLRGLALKAGAAADARDGGSAAASLSNRQVGERRRRRSSWSADAHAPTLLLPIPPPPIRALRTRPKNVSVTETSAHARCALFAIIRARSQPQTAASPPPPRRTAAGAHGAVCAIGAVLAALAARAPAAWAALAADSLAQCASAAARLVGHPVTLLHLAACAALGRAGAAAPLPLPLPLPGGPRRGGGSADALLPLAAAFDRLRAACAVDAQTQDAGARAAGAADALGLACLGLGLDIGGGGGVRPDAAEASRLRAAALDALLALARVQRHEDLQFAAGAAAARIARSGPLLLNADAAAALNASGAAIGLAPMPFSLRAADGAAAGRGGADSGGGGGAISAADALDVVVRREAALLLDNSPHVAGAAAVYLLCLVRICGNGGGGGGSALSAHLPALQGAFLKQLAARSEFVQEVAGRGLAAVYAAAADGREKEVLVEAMVEHLGGGRKKSIAMPGIQVGMDVAGTPTSTSTSTAGGGVDAGGAMGAYCEMCAIACDVGQPQLVYAFLASAGAHPAWTVGRGALAGDEGGTGGGGGGAALDLGPHIDRLIPRLYRYRFDAGAKTRSAMERLWKAAVAGAAARAAAAAGGSDGAAAAVTEQSLVTSHFEAILQELLRAAGDRSRFCVGAARAGGGGAAADSAAELDAAAAAVAAEQLSRAARRLLYTPPLHTDRWRDRQSACLALADALEWRDRQSACLALADALAGRTWAQLGPHLGALWGAAARAMDDLRESVAVAAADFARTLANVTVRLCSPSGGGGEGAGGADAPQGPAVAGQGDAGEGFDGAGGEAEAARDVQRAVASLAETLQQEGGDGVAAAEALRERSAALAAAAAGGARGLGGAPAATAAAAAAAATAQSREDAAAAVGVLLPWLLDVRRRRGVVAQDAAARACAPRLVAVCPPLAAAASAAAAAAAGLSLKCAAVAGLSLKTLQRVVAVADARALRPHLARLICTLVEGLSALEPQALQYMQFHAERQLGISADRMERLRLSAARSGPLQAALDRCCQHLDTPSALELMPRLMGLLRGGVGLATRSAAACVVTSLCADAPRAAAACARPLLQTLSNAALSERSAAVRASYTSALAAVARLAPAPLVAPLARRLCRLFAASNEDLEGGQRAAAAALLRELAARAPEAMGGRGSEGEWRRSGWAAALPLAYVARHDADAAVAAAFATVWDEGLTQLQLGAAGGGGGGGGGAAAASVRGEAGACALLLAPIAAEIVGALGGTSRGGRLRAAAAAAALAAALGARLGEDAAGAEVLGALLRAVPGRAWERKEALLEAVVKVAVECRGGMELSMRGAEGASTAAAAAAANDDGADGVDGEDAELESDAPGAVNNGVADAPAEAGGGSGAATSGTEDMDVDAGAQATAAADAEDGADGGSAAAAYEDKLGDLAAEAEPMDVDDAAGAAAALRSGAQQAAAPAPPRIAYGEVVGLLVRQLGRQSKLVRRAAASSVAALAPAFPECDTFAAAAPTLLRAALLPPLLPTAAAAAPLTGAAAAAPTNAAAAAAPAAASPAEDPVMQARAVEALTAAWPRGAGGGAAATRAAHSGALLSAAAAALPTRVWSVRVQLLRLIKTILEAGFGAATADAAAAASCGRALPAVAPAVASAGGIGDLKYSAVRVAAAEAALALASVSPAGPGGLSLVPFKEALQDVARVAAADGDASVASLGAKAQQALVCTEEAVAKSTLQARAIERELEAVSAAPPAKCAAAAAAPTAQATALASWDLLTHILSYKEFDDWFFTAPVSRLVRAAYTVAVIGRAADNSESWSGVTWVCRTRLAQALHTPARLDAALLSSGDSDSDFARAVRWGNCDTSAASYAAGASSSAPLVRRFAALGARVNGHALRGAARACDAALLETLHALVRARQRGVTRDTWCVVGVTLAERGDGGGALTWLSRQMRPAARWPRRYSLALCQRAAARRHLQTLRFLLATGQALFGPLEDPPPTRATPFGDAALDLVEAAVWGGDVGTVQWVLENAPCAALSERAVEIAAYRGHLPLLMWLRGKRCPCNEGAICAKVAGRDGTPCTQRILQWMRGCGWGEWSVAAATAMLRAALSLRHSRGAVRFGLAEYLLREGAQWSTTLHDLEVHEVLSSRSPAEAVVWAFEHGCPWGEWGSQQCLMLGGLWRSAGAAARGRLQGCSDMWKLWHASPRKRFNRGLYP
ncbi:proteasome stabiliser-domain-containing protein [Tribonema minus]|uniref:Proteasome stabiliser-domain-containing protein n=1 Tax=Tribonema minus TaxID=303371 RepID=A0A836CAR0_9STRA|nr:proteasome stabiliser-domain-containing protein [Tribonema minus]